jgi:MtN3 and saliva related transmembrane protein
MMSGALTETIGAVAGALTTLSFVPQVYKVVREGQTAGISRGMYGAFVLGVFLWFIYGMRIGSTSIIVANLVTFVLASTVLIAKLRAG